MYQESASVPITHHHILVSTSHDWCLRPHPYSRGIWHILVGGIPVYYYIDYSTGDINDFTDVLVGCKTLNLLGR